MDRNKRLQSAKLSKLARKASRHPRARVSLILTAGLAFTLSGCGEKPEEPELEVMPATAPVVLEKRSPIQMFLDLSHVRISLKTMHDQHYLNYFRLETPAPDLHPLVVPQVRNYIIESVHGGTLLDRFMSAFQSKVTEEELTQMNQWLGSPLGRRVTNLEMGKFNNPNFAQKAIKFDSLDPERQALISEYVDINNLVSISINVLRLTKIGILEGIQSSQRNPRKIPPPEVTENDLVYARYNLLDHYSTLFQSLSYAELEQLVNICQNPTYQKVTMAINRALVLAFNNTSGNIGRIIAQAIPQIEAAERKAAEEKAALETPEVPERPPVKRRHHIRNDNFKPEEPSPNSLPTRQKDFDVKPLY